MFDEDRLRKLKSFREQLDSQDAIVLESSYEIPVRVGIVITRIFNAILVEFPNSTPKFEYDGAPSAVRAQISVARSAIQGMIDDHEREAEEEAKRYELCVSVQIARELLKPRIEEGKTLAIHPEYAERYQDNVESWAKRTIGTLGRVFSSQLNAQDFEKLVQPQNAPTFTDAARSGVEYLRSIDEELSIRQRTSPKVEATIMGKKIFIGHGRSLVWRELKDFLQDDLHLPVDEFNREPPAGKPTVERLNEMLDSAGFALLVMTGEDEQPGGSVRARENVVHEAGLFQGRLGFKRAIILLELGCETFSNIDGLTVIPFPKDHISASYQEIRRTLEREGMLPTGGATNSGA